MYLIHLAVSSTNNLQFQTTLSKCCRRKDSCVLQSYGCPETPSGIVSCGCNSCNIPSSITLCCGASNSRGNPDSNPCNVCEEKSCSCKKKKGCDCNNKYFIYYPEVEYPSSIMEIIPFYFSNCWSY